MAILQMGNSPGQRISAGNMVIASANVADTTPIKKRLAAFKSLHQQYCKCQDAVENTSTSLHAGEQALAEADAAQDAAVEKLAAKLVGDGLPRKNPFKPFGAANASDLEKLGFEHESRNVLRLTARVLKRKDLSARTVTAAKDLQSKAQAVQRLAAALPQLQQAEADAISERAAVGRPWASAFARLKRAARTAEDDGADGLYATLFQTKKKRRRKRKAKAAAKA